MLRYTMRLLIDGDQNVVEYYRRAVERWKEIWARPGSNELRKLTAMLPAEEAWFEQNCGRGWLGREIMVAAGFGMLDPDWSKSEEVMARARLLNDAIGMSGCGLE